MTLKLNDADKKRLQEQNTAMNKTMAELSKTGTALYQRGAVSELERFVRTLQRALMALVSNKKTYQTPLRVQSERRQDKLDDTVTNRRTQSMR